MKIFSDIIDKLYKREINKSEFKSYFEKVDFENFFNHLAYYIDPNELIMKIGDRRVLEKLYFDGEIYAAIDKRLAALTSTKLVLESPDPVVQKFFEDQILKHERQLKLDFWWAIPYGFSVEQILYNKDGSGKVDGFVKEDFWRFLPMPDGIHVKCTQSYNPEWNNKLMNYGQFVLTTNNASQSKPTGDAMFSRLYLAWLFKCQADDLWMRLMERFALGFLIGKTPEGSDVKEMLEVLKKAAKGSAIAVTTKDSIEYLQSSRDSTMFTAANDKINNLFYRVILGETQTSSMEQRGSSASAGIHNEIRKEKTLADIYLVEQAFEETMRQIGAVNGIDPDLIPTANLIYDQGLELDRATRDSSLASIPNFRFTKKYFEDQYGFEPDEIEIVEPASSDPFGGLFNKNTGKKSSFLTSDNVKEYLNKQEKICNDCGGTHGNQSC